jgi:hypothetical protein
VTGTGTVIETEIGTEIATETESRIKTARGAKRGMSGIAETELSMSDETAGFPNRDMIELGTNAYLWLLLHMPQPKSLTAGLGIADMRRKTTTGPGNGAMVMTGKRELVVCPLMRAVVMTGHATMSTEKPHGKMNDVRNQKNPLSIPMRNIAAVSS